jgi:hypothetical protein
LVGESTDYVGNSLMEANDMGTNILYGDQAMNPGDFISDGDRLLISQAAGNLVLRIGVLVALGLAFPTSTGAQSRWSIGGTLAAARFVDFNPATESPVQARPREAGWIACFVVSLYAFGRSVWP